MKLTKAGADANITDKLQRTPMHFAAVRGYKNVIRELANRGYKHQIHMPNIYGCNALREATKGCELTGENNHYEALQLLVDLGSDVNDRCMHYTPLHKAAMRDYRRMVKILVDDGADIYAKDTDFEYSHRYETPEKLDGSLHHTKIWYFLKKFREFKESGKNDKQADQNYKEAETSLLDCNFFLNI